MGQTFALHDKVQTTQSIDLNDIRLLMKVIEHGSYTAASHVTGVPKSTISQRITALERAVGTGLLRRTSRSFSLTEAGTLLLPHARDIDVLARKLEHALLERSDDLAGTLRVSCCSAFAHYALPPLVADFLAQHPEVAVQVEATNRLIDLIGEGFDITIRSHAENLRDSSLIQRVIARAPCAIVASPDWIDKNGTPLAPENIRPKQTLCFAMTRACTNWTLYRGDAEIVVKLMPRVVSNDIALLLQTAIAGAGIACLPDYVVAGALQDGRLARILPEWSPAACTLSLLTPPKAQSSRLAQSFSDFLAAGLPAVLPTLSRGSGL